MREVRVRPVPLARLAAILPPARAAVLEEAAARAREAFGDRVVWHVSATAQGGGVAEMLQTLLAYGTGAGVENRWLVLDGDADFFAITKRLHNLLHGQPGDGGPLGAAEHAHYRATLAGNLPDLVRRVAPGSPVLLHDPQTAGLAEGVHRSGGHVVWRCHVGRDEPNACTKVGWDFLKPYVADAEAFVFSRRSYAPEWASDARLVVIPPSIDPFSAKNVALDEAEVASVLARAGLVTGAPASDAVSFPRRVGSTGTVRDRDTGDFDGGPPPYDAPLVVQVSRWDRLKDMEGVMAGFALAADRVPRAHLVLAGPAVAAVTDDPEGAEVLSECRARWRSLPDALRRRVHLVSVPMDDPDENAIIVNALQRHAAVVVQKSLEEGFGLTVTEAMWKARAVLASRVGGIDDQIVSGDDGLLLDDPADLAGFADALVRLLSDAPLRARLGVAAHERVLERYLGDRHLLQYADLFTRLVSAEQSGGARA
jgi:trehalose synthase